MPGRHPDDDLLADLAADVLPAGQARAVEAHVLACHRCAGLLEDAERVRSLLLSADPGPVPADVWHRIEAALAAQAAPPAPPAPGHAVTGSPAVGSAPAGRVVPLPSSSGSSDDGAPGWADDSDPLDDPARWNGRPGGAVRIGGGSRRDARDGGVRRRGSLLLAVAAVFAVVAVVGSVKLLGRGGSSEASLSAGAAAGSASASAAAGNGASAAQPVIVESGRNYLASTLAAQASSLLAATTASRGVTSNGGSGAKATSPSAAPGLSRLPAAAVAPDPAASDITNPARLAACLQALGVGQERLVAVDLATYEGREAAILLLTTSEGSGHEVWAVQRTCAPGAEGALNYTRLKD